MKQIPARFIDGPIDGQRRILPEIVPTFRVAVPASLTYQKPGADGSPYHHKIAVYVLWDNWPPRYIFDRIEKY